jgi:hypothetical protein
MVGKEVRGWDLEESNRDRDFVRVGAEVWQIGFHLLSKFCLEMRGEWR